MQLACSVWKVLVRVECVHQRNEVAIILDIISPPPALPVIC